MSTPPSAEPGEPLRHEVRRFLNEELGGLSLPLRGDGAWTEPRKSGEAAHLLNVAATPARLEDPKVG